MPLSKRINNLHINNGLIMENSIVNQQNIIEWGPGPPYLQNNNSLSSSNSIPSTPPESVQSGDWSNTNNGQYMPDLNETENPYYYNINKLLFEMYVERQQRNTENL